MLRPAEFAHFLLYRAWAALLQGRDDVRVELDVGRNQAVMYVDLAEFVGAIGDPGGDADLTHIILGLRRLDLLGAVYLFGDMTEHDKNSPYRYAIKIQPSPVGIELYGWALGIPGLTPLAFRHLDESAHPDLDVALLTSAVCPQVPPRSSADGPETAEQTIT